MGTSAQATNTHRECAILGIVIVIVIAIGTVIVVIILVVMVIILVVMVIIIPIVIVIAILLLSFLLLLLLYLLFVIPVCYCYLLFLLKCFIPTKMGRRRGPGSKFKPKPSNNHMGNQRATKVAPTPGGPRFPTCGHTSPRSRSFENPQSSGLWEQAPKR